MRIDVADAGGAVWTIARDEPDGRSVEVSFHSAARPEMLDGLVRTR